MLKRQESSLSASRRQAAAAAGTTPPPPESHHAKAIGCMSGIIQLFSKYQSSNRRLTFGKKQEKRKPPPSPTRSAIDAAKNSAEEDNSVKQTTDTGRLMCAVKVPRSPTLPPEIRRSNAARSPENSRTTPTSSLVARLMGLEDLGSAAKRPGLTPENTITEKRQRLMQALEKCNEDLEALKSIIKAVQTADVRLQPPHSPPPKRDHLDGGDGGAVAAQPCMKMCTESAAEKPSISVDELTRSPVSNNCVVQNSMAGGMRILQHRKPIVTKKPGEEDEAIAKLLTKSTIIESSLEMRRRAAAAAASPPWSSRAMVESVEEVCNDIAWGEKREIGRIGLVVQDHVCRELIEELVKELKSCNIIQPLPLEACKRKLCF